MCALLAHENDMFNIFKKKDNLSTLNAFANGKLISLEQVNDPVFSQKLMGDGIAIQVTNDTIYSPVDAKITLIAETNHAIGLTCSNGVELMIHVGLETVNLKGNGFKPLVKIGDFVNAGTPLLLIDTDFMKDQKIDLVTPLIIINHQDHPFKVVATSPSVEHGEKIITFNK